MNKFSFFFLLILFAGVSRLSFSQGTMFFHEGFESGSEPTGWTYEYVSGLVDWQFKDGGFTSTPLLPGSGYPPYAYQGYRNAMFHVQNLSNETTKFITPPINLSYGIKPELTFWHAQDKRFTLGEFRNDELRVYVKTSKTAPWVKIKEYTETVSSWTERNLFIPDTLLSESVYIAFEGKTNNGYGVCIDSVIIIDNDTIPRYIESLTIKQASTDFVPTGSQKNDILRIDFSVKGNDGALILDSIVLKSLNTDDSDISPNGVKIYASNDTLFQNSVKIGGSINFSNGVAVFDNINRSLITGLSSIWVTYDIINDTQHRIHEHILDAMIEKENIRINNSLYPPVDRSPTGSRIIYEALLYDDFETDKGWVLTGEFQRNTTLGKGGSIGNADPTSAASGTKVLGSDLTGLGSYQGDYEFNLTDRAYKATSPYISCKYYKDLYLYFDRWLNVDGSDTVTIDFATSTKDNWNKYWQNSGTLITNQWTPMRYVISSAISRKDSVQVRFTVGPTNDFWNFSGWNIDDIVIVGNYISKDVGVTNWIAPLDGCGHTSAEYVRVTIKNYAGDPLIDPLPVSFSFNGGTTVYRDTIQSPNIPVDGSIDYTITKPVNLTTPGWYNNVYAKTNLPGDEDVTNDRLNKIIFIAPTYTLPYTQNFETNYAYYRTGGINSSWAYGTPAGAIINNAASGTKAWVTKLNGNYNNLENSYLESPCFNFSGTDSVIFEFKCIGISEDQVDGLSILYSLNEGANWDLLPDHHDYYWNWYNETNISQLGLPGIDDTGSQWLTFRQLLPAAFSNQSSVKFRFVFESNATNNYEGFGIDDIKIYAAPYDVGVEALTYPFDRCEWNDTTHVKITVKNYGPTTVKSGTKIPLELKFNSTTIKDTLLLTTDLAVNGSKLFTFNNTVDMSYAGAYNFTIYTKLESNPFLYNETVSNDTLFSIVNVTGMPRYNPFNDLIGDHPINTTLDAGEASVGVDYSSYNWSTGATTRTLLVTVEDKYYVTVTNAVGCTAIDSVEVIDSEIDLTMDTIYTELVDSCERNVLSEISIRFTNNGFNALDPPADTVFLAYQINNLALVKDTLILTGTIATSAPTDFTFTKKADFTNPGNYTLKAFINILKDLNHADDTVSKTFRTKGYVDISFAEDTIYSSNADTVVLAPTPLYSTYNWSSGGTSSSITNLPNLSQWYKVTVTDPLVCNPVSGPEIDSIYVETYDFGIDSIVSPINACAHSIVESIQVSLHNYSGNTYNPGTKIPFRYNFNNLGYMNDTATLGSSFGPGVDKIVTLSKTINPSAIGNYNLKVFVNAKQDANEFNDSINHDFETWGYPNVELAYDTIFTTQADTVILYPTLGFNTYNWSDGSDNDTLVVTDKFSKKYVVTVNDIHACGSDKDSTQIITYNLGVSSIISPKNSCSHTGNETVRMYVKNYSNDTILSGTNIDVGYIFNGGVPVIETLTLASNLNPSQTASYYFTNTVDMATVGTYTLKVFTDFGLDVYRDNDTIYEGIKTFGFPSVEIGPDIYTTRPDTVKIVANPGYNFYTWNEGTKNDTLFVTKPQSFNYIVTVTDINGCNASDNLTVYTYNVAANSINSPIAKCNPSNSEPVIIGVKNTSKDTLQIGEPLEVGYHLNGGAYVSQAFTLTSILYPDSTSLFTMTSYPADISLNQIHQFKVFAKLTNIDVNTNDTTLLSVDNLNPNLDLGADVNTSNPQYIIDAGPGYASYLWQDGSSNQSYTVDINNQTIDHIYSVTVTTATGCSGSDQIVVTFDITPDLSITDMSSPYSECWQSTKAYPVMVTIRNSGAINIPATTPITVGYRIGNGTPVIENKVLATALNANQTLSHTFVDQYTFAAADVYTFKPFVKYPGDLDASNDTLFKNIDISQPDVSFNYDTIYFTQSATITPLQSFVTYLWDTGSTNSEITVTTTGTYSVIVTDGNGCYGSGKIYCEKGTGIDNLIEGNGYSISYYPNPASDKLLVQFDNSKSTDVIIELINTNGQILYNKQLNNIQNTIERIDVNKYAKGVYYIRFKVNNEYYNRKVVIQ